jgi:hypothetical protein
MGFLAPLRRPVYRVFPIVVNVDRPQIVRSSSTLLKKTKTKLSRFRFASDMHEYSYTEHTLRLITGKHRLLRTEQWNGGSRPVRLLYHYVDRLRNRRDECCLNR